MSIPYLSIVVCSVCAIAFYRAGRMERSSGLLWTALSIAASFTAIRFLPWGMIGVLISQVALFVAITFFRMLRHR